MHKKKLIGTKEPKSSGFRMGILIQKLSILQPMLIRRSILYLLWCDDDTISYKHQDLCCIAKSYFDGLFKGWANEVVGNFDYIRHFILEEDSNILLVPFTVNDFKTAFFQMNSDKSPSPGGLNPAFLKKNWHLYGPKIYYICCNKLAWTWCSSSRGQFYHHCPHSKM